jgi:hypothetical protein
MSKALGSLAASKQMVTPPHGLSEPTGLRFDDPTDHLLKSMPPARREIVVEPNAASGH